MTDSLRDALIKVLQRELSGFESLDRLEQLTSGASQETYRVDFRAAGAAGSLALRRSPPGLQSESSVGGIALTSEANLFRLASTGGIPVPAILGELKPEDGLGSGFLMDWLDGETMGQRVLRSKALAGVRPRLARQCGEILGRIHALDWESAGLEHELDSVSTAELVDQTWETYRGLNVPVPMIDYCWRWLKENLPRQTRKTLVHGDFRNGNLMITPEGITAVLDWELAHIGDPVRDLGYLCVNSWRFGNRQLPVGGFGHIEDLLDGYRSTSGIKVDPQELKFWEVFGSYWWAVATLLMAMHWRTGETPSLERPVIGRRSSEAQMDCVNLLIPGDFTLPDLDQSLTEGTQLPMPAEMLSGAVEYLKGDIGKQLNPHDRFLARVAANSVQIAQRELIYGPESERAECKRLEALLGKQGDLNCLRWILVEHLRNGLSLENPELSAHLRQTVTLQLFIDQPPYSALSMNR